MEIVRDLLVTSEQPIVRHYHPGEMRVRDITFEKSVIITPREGAIQWPPQSFDELEAQHLARLLELDPRPELILLGTGETQHFPPREMMAPLIDANIGVEVMTSSAACRTWNIVLSEARQAAAAILIR
ncbi:MAG: Mth938-like domain-containing protein [Gammaproteobacteria bacterium]